MHEIDFLGTDVPLTKKITLKDGEYQTEPYPHVRNMTSYRCSFSTLEELYALLKEHAAQNHAVLKGLLRQQIQMASRAGLTDPSAKTHWILLDLDFESGWTSIEDFVDDLDPALEGASFIFQHSSSAGIKGRAGLRGHVFILLEKPILAATLKLWLRDRNLSHPILANQLELTATGLGLRYPLDVTTCQNDKLIYIAPPICEGFEDPIKDERIVLYRREHERADLTKSVRLSAQAIDSEQRKKVNELRVKAGLPKRTPRFKEYGDVEVLSNPDSAVVTDIKMARGFVYLNLNGGDSWGYYFPADNPEIIYNFKGEPPVRFKDIAPDVYKMFREQYREAQKERERQAFKEELAQTRKLAEKVLGGSFRPFVFRDRERDTYYNALYFPEQDRLELAKAASVQRLQHFMLQYGHEAPEIIEDWTLEFDPTRLEVVDFEAKWVNTFRPTQYIRSGGNLACTEIPPTIDKVINSLCVGDEEAKDHFLNWLAYLFQTRKKIGTSWIFHGIQGTGKGVFVSRVLKPLLGPDHVVEYTARNFEDEFNAPLEQALVLWIDEFHIESTRSAGNVMNKLKNLITEERIIIRGMRQAPVQVNSYTNVIIGTNHPDPVSLPEHDRRFNVAPAQEQKLVLTLKEIDQIEKELNDFAGYLTNREVDVVATRTILQNEARENMIIASQTSTERFFSSARKGDLDYFLEYIQPGGPLMDTAPRQMFEMVIAKWCRGALTKDWSPVFRNDLRAAYSYIIGTPVSIGKFTRMCAIHRLPNELITTEETKTRAAGHRVVWTGDMDRIKAVLDALTSENKEYPKLVSGT